jgi:uncharacterized protein (TIGR03067 family)
MAVGKKVIRPMVFNSQHLHSHSLSNRHEKNHIMKRIIIRFLTAVLPVMISAAEEQAAGPTQDGVWKPIAAVLGGVRVPESALKAITLKIMGASYEVVVEGEKESDKGTRTLDTSTTPKRLTIKSTDGPNRGKTFLAIYEMKDADSLRICYDLSGTDFPKEFKAPKGTQLYLVGYRRQKD